MPELYALLRVTLTSIMCLAIPQLAAGQQSPYSAEEFWQFDFWIGSWIVSD